MNSNEHTLSREEVLAIFATATPGLNVNFDGFWFDLPEHVHDRIVERAGFERDALRGITFWVRLDGIAPLERVLGTYKLYQVTPRHYYLQMLEDGRLIRKYQQILGSLGCGKADDEAIDLLIDRVSSKLGPLVRADAAKKGYKLAALRTLNEEVALLSATGERIALPKEHLVHYPRIKVLIENAGGVYNARGHFDFEPGNDALDVLARLKAGEVVNIQQQTQSFYTPAGLALDVCRDALPSPDADLSSKPLAGKRYLEPEAGEGALADVIRQWGADVTCVENFAVAVAKLRAKGHTVHDRDFLSLTPEDIGLFDGIVANPPFASDADIRHVRHMLAFLKPGGTLSVIMSPRWQESDRRLHVEFRELLQGYDVQRVQIPAGAFKTSGTGVATVRLVIRNNRVATEAPKGQLELLAA